MLPMDYGRGALGLSLCGFFPPHLGFFSDLLWSQRTIVNPSVLFGK